MRCSKFVRGALNAGAMIVLATGVASCHHSSTEPLLIGADGRIVRAAEGCLVIQTKSNTYRPLNLPSEFAVEGLAVHFDAVSRPTASVCMTGESVSLLHIERIP